MQLTVLSSSLNIGWGYFGIPRVILTDRGPQFEAELPPNFNQNRFSGKTVFYRPSPLCPAFGPPSEDAHPEG